MGTRKGDAVADMGAEMVNASSSKRAWPEAAEKGQQLYGDDPNARPVGLPNLYGNGDLIPTAMESEVFDKHGVGRVQRQSELKERGCWARFKRGLGMIWKTKDMEDTQYDRELYIRTTIRELVIYLIFLVVLCILSFGMTSQNYYYYNRAMQALFVNGGTLPFNSITSVDDVWMYFNGRLREGLYWSTWYNNDSLTDDSLGLVCYENKLLGLPRLRQLRVRNDSCVAPLAFKREMPQCYAAFSDSAADDAAFGLENDTAWRFSSAGDTGSMFYVGAVATYGGGGYVQGYMTTLDLPAVQEQANPIFTQLFEGRWIDRATRAIFIDFSLYNANMNLFAIIKLVLEFPATGGVLPSASVRIQKLIRYVTTFDYFVLACEGIFCAFILYYVIEETMEIRKNRLSYFTKVWNLLDIVVIIIALCCIAFSIYSQMTIDDKLNSLTMNANKYANFEFISFARGRYNDAVAIMVFFAWIKIFKYISFNKTMSQLSSTLSRCSKDLGGFAIMFFIFFFAYAQLGYLLFGAQLKDYSTIYDSIFSLLRLILGDFDYHAMESVNRILAPIFFVTFVFFVFFVLLNMFLAIINDTYSAVKAELATQKNEFEISDFIRRGYANMLHKLKLKKDRIVDIQAALGEADFNQDRVIDYDEWRTQLKQRGYAEQEIESMFAKYDLDGDRVLDEHETNRMRQELAGATTEYDQQTTDLFGMAASFPSDPYVEYGEDSGAKRGGVGGAVSQEELQVLSRRVDRIDATIASIVLKIDDVLTNLEKMERVKMRHREEVAKIIGTATQTADGKDKSKKLERDLMKELDRFDNDAGEKRASDE